MPLFDCAPELPGMVGSMMDAQSGPSEELEQNKNREVPSGNTRNVGDSGAAIGYAVMSLVRVSDKEIAKNNRLALLMQGHSQWLAKRNDKNTIMEVDAMRKKQVCDGCGKDKALSMCSGDFLCSSCAAVAGSVSNRPEAVARVVVRRGQEKKMLGLLVAEKGQAWLMAAAQPYLPEQVQIKVENETMERIASLVGYKGEDGDGLIEVIETHEAVRIGYEDQQRRLCEIVGCSDRYPEPGHGLLEEIKKIIENAAQVAAHRDRAIDLLQRANLAMPDGELNYELLPERIARLASEVYRLRSSALLPVDLIMALDCHEDQWDMAAIQTAAQLEEAERQLALAGTDLTGYRKTTERLAEENSVLADQLAAGEQQWTLREQMLEQIAEALGLDGVRMEDVAGHIARLRASGSNKCTTCEDRTTIDAIITALGLDAGATHGEVLDTVEDVLAAQRPGEVFRVSAGRITGLDSHLLDLALDAMRGTITGLDPDRIAVLRGGAV